MAGPFTLHHGDAAGIIAALVPARSIDMVYMDPPFNTGQVWTGAAGSFDDRWTMDAAGAVALLAVRSRQPIAAAMIDAVPLSPGGRAYLAIMGDLLVGLKQALRLTGTLWLHCDDTMRAYLRLVADCIFAPSLYLGEIVWKRTSAHSSATKNFGRVHDVVMVYARSAAAAWRLWRIGGEFFYGDPCERAGEGDVRPGVAGFVDDRLNAASNERCGYPTQKPVALIERFIRCATLTGDSVLDPTCGSGTTLVAALRNERNSIGIDRSADAIACSYARLASARPRQMSLFGAA